MVLDHKQKKQLLKAAGEILTDTETLKQKDGQIVKLSLLRDKWHSLYRRTKEDLKLARAKAAIDAVTIERLEQDNQPKTKIGKLLYKLSFWLDQLKFKKK